MVYADSLQHYGWKYGKSCHLIADTLDELHEFAIKIGMKRACFQPSPPATLDHYDLTAKKRDLAIKLGAKPISRIELVAIIRERRNQQNQPQNQPQ